MVLAMFGVPEAWLLIMDICLLYLIRLIYPLIIVLLWSWWMLERLARCALLIFLPSDQQCG